jgi:hypothetical protein
MSYGCCHCNDLAHLVGQVLCYDIHCPALIRRAIG